MQAVAVAVLVILEVLVGQAVLAVAVLALLIRLQALEL